jgi:hypothetical protein
MGLILGSHNAHVSTSPPAIPDSGFSPVRFWPWHVLCASSLSPRCLSAGTHTPRSCRFTHKLVPTSRVSLYRRCVRPLPWNRQVPRAPLPQRGVTTLRETYRISSAGITPPSLLLRAHAPSRCPPHASGLALARAVFAGCCQPLLGIGPSRLSAYQSFLACLDPYSGCP